MQGIQSLSYSLNHALLGFSPSVDGRSAGQCAGPNLEVGLCGPDT